MTSGKSLWGRSPKATERVAQPMLVAGDPSRDIAQGYSPPAGFRGAVWAQQRGSLEGKTLPDG